MDILNKAINIAVAAHASQKDKAGVDYIAHLIYVALNQDSIHNKVVAILHDILEDTCFS